MLYLGVDIGGTKIVAGIVDDRGTVLSQARRSTPASEGGDRVLSSAIGLAAELLAESQAEVAAIGIGTGGQVDTDIGVIVSATELLPGWAGQPVAQSFVERFALPTFVENDVNALATGEYRFGSARSKKTVAFLAIGTGVGGSLIIDGQVQHGAHWSGAEFGHILLSMEDNARTDFGGHQGTLEAYASGHGLVTTWREITGERAAITGEEIARYAEEDHGSPEALAIAQTGRYLGFGLVSIVSMFDPELIVIGGGLASLGDRLLEPARKILKDRALPGPSTCPVVVASLGEDSSLIGAAAVAMEYNER